MAVSLKLWLALLLTAVAWSNTLTTTDTRCTPHDGTTTVTACTISMVAGGSYTGAIELAFTATGSWTIAGQSVGAFIYDSCAWDTTAGVCLAGGGQSGTAGTFTVHLFAISGGLVGQNPVGTTTQNVVIGGITVALSVTVVANNEEPVHTMWNRGTGVNCSAGTGATYGTYRYNNTCVIADVRPIGLRTFGAIGTVTNDLNFGTPMCPLVVDSDQYPSILQTNSLGTLFLPNATNPASNGGIFNPQNCTSVYPTFVGSAFNLGGGSAQFSPSLKEPNVIYSFAGANPATIVKSVLASPPTVSATQTTIWTIPDGQVIGLCDGGSDPITTTGWKFFYSSFNGSQNCADDIKRNDAKFGYAINLLNPPTPAEVTAAVAAGTGIVPGKMVRINYTCDSVTNIEGCDNVKKIIDPHSIGDGTGGCVGNTGLTFRGVSMTDPGTDGWSYIYTNAHCGAHKYFHRLKYTGEWEFVILDLYDSQTDNGKHSLTDCRTNGQGCLPDKHKTTFHGPTGGAVGWFLANDTGVVTIQAQYRDAMVLGLEIGGGKVEWNGIHDHATAAKHSTKTGGVLPIVASAIEATTGSACYLAITAHASGSNTITVDNPGGDGSCAGNVLSVSPGDQVLIGCANDSSGQTPDLQNLVSGVPTPWTISSVTAGPPQQLALTGLASTGTLTGPCEITKVVTSITNNIPTEVVDVTRFSSSGRAIAVQEVVQQRKYRWGGNEERTQLTQDGSRVCFNTQDGSPNRDQIVCASVLGQMLSENDFDLAPGHPVRVVPTGGGALQIDLNTPTDVDIKCSFSTSPAMTSTTDVTLAGPYSARRATATGFTPGPYYWRCRSLDNPGSPVHSFLTAVGELSLISSNLNWTTLSHGQWTGMNHTQWTGMAH